MSTKRLSSIRIQDSALRTAGTALLLWAVLCPAVAGAAPAAVPYRGYLTDAEGNPYTGEVPVEAALFSQAEDGVALTTCTWESLSVKDGELAFTLGGGPECTPALTADLLAVAELWLEVSINGDTLLPRQQVLSVPYALVCEEAANLGGTAAEEFVTGKDLEDGGYLVSGDVQPVCLAGGSELALKSALDEVSGQCVSEDDLTTALAGYCPTPCYSDTNVGEYLTNNGYVAGPQYTDQDVAEYLAAGGYAPGPYYSDAAVNALLATKSYCAAPCYGDADVAALKAKLWCLENCDAGKIGDCKERTCDGAAQKCTQGGNAADGTVCQGGKGTCMSGTCVQPLVCGGVKCPFLTAEYKVTCNAKQHCEYANQDGSGWKQWDVWIYVPAGSFWMGSEGEGGDPDEAPVHLVTISQGYFIMKYEVTVAHYLACKTAGICTDGLSTVNWDGDKWEINWAEANAQAPKHYRPGHPQNALPWDAAVTLCGWVVPSGRLPTEAEWEYAATGPVHLKYPWGDSPAPTCANGTAVFDEDGSGSKPWGCDTCTAPGCSGTKAVGSKAGGASWCGALDMAGNVWEWCKDLYSGTYYTADPVTDPENQVSGSYRVIRGGSFYNGAVNMRSARRISNAPSYRSAYLGARCLRPQLYP
jgi:iron(II)-dependent oxidoreductase